MLNKDVSCTMQARGKLYSFAKHSGTDYLVFTFIITITITSTVALSYSII
jgi:hypothetical protein